MTRDEQRAHADRRAQPSMDAVFKALADPSRRKLLDALNKRNGQSLRELCVVLDIARQSVSKHLAILEQAKLVAITWQGREKLHYLNAAPVNDIADRWIHRYNRPRANALADLKHSLEDISMEKQTFVYETYIKSTPELVWKGLTDPAFTKHYWSTVLHTDWEVGSTITWDNHGVMIADPAQVVLECDPFQRLAYTWHTFTPELAAKFGFDDELQAKLMLEGRSKVLFELEDRGSEVKLTVTHDDFDADSGAINLIRGGWPQVLSGLKSFLETEDLASISASA